MDGHPHPHLPGIGLRNLKSAFSAALCAAVYYLIDRNPTFACIGAVYGMGNDMGHSWQPGSVVLCIILFNTPVDTYVSYALNRVVDTGVGVAVSMVINYLLPRERLDRWKAALLSRRG